MSRRYTPDQQAYALQYLAACNGDVNLTAAALGIPKRTLFRWRQLHALNPVPLLPQSLPQFPLNPVPQVPLLPQFPLNPLPLPQNNVSFPLLPGAPQVSLNPRHKLRHRHKVKPLWQYHPASRICYDYHTDKAQRITNAIADRMDESCVKL